MARVLLDTNALMMPVELDVRVFDELDRLLGGVSRKRSGTPTGAPLAGADTGAIDRIEESSTNLLVPRAVLTELDRLADGGGREGIAASVGADLARERCRIVDHDAGYADDAVVELAETGAYDYVLTNDRALRRRVVERGVPVIGLSGQNHLRVIRT